MGNRLDNYVQLIGRVDALCAGILEKLSDRITCHSGCSGCCTSITIFPVEAAALQAALDELPAEEQAIIRSHVELNSGGERCPLLKDQRCLLYSARPVICRTHGFPIVYGEGEERNYDCCPLNLIDDDQTLSGATVVDLDRLNTLLVAINALYISQAGCELPERLSIAEALKAKK